MFYEICSQPLGSYKASIVHMTVNMHLFVTCKMGLDTLTSVSQFKTVR